MSKSLNSDLSKAAPAATLVHVHGVWLMPNVTAGATARRFNRPLVVSPRGMLAADALKFSRPQKLIFWKLLQERAYAKAAVWHATSEAEAEDIRRFGVKAPIATIPNGVDMPPPRRQREAVSTEDTRKVLFLGRIHPKKGLQSLVEAWTRVSPQFLQWRLRIVGPDEDGHAADLRALASRLGNGTVSIEPPLYGPQKSEVLSDAAIFVLPTLNENFGIAVAEALAVGVPAIVTKGAPWSGLQTEECGWWIDHGVEPLADALHAAMALSDADREAMGNRARTWMARDFGWERIAQDMLAVYDWAGHGGSPPASVRLN